MINFKLTIILLLIGYSFSCRSQNADTLKVDNHLVSSLNSPDYSNPESTLKSFWWAVKNKMDDIAMTCVNSEKIKQGRHGRDIKKYLIEMKNIKTQEFEFKSSESRVSIHSPVYSMDFDFEQKNGKWLIISTHP